MRCVGIDEEPGGYAFLWEKRTDTNTASKRQQQRGSTAANQADSHDAC
jgi:hypothetical protein